jgi:hypothetical protein
MSKLTIEITQVDVRNKGNDYIIIRESFRCGST